MLSDEQIDRMQGWVDNGKVPNVLIPRWMMRELLTEVKERRALQPNSQQPTLPI